jgi:guanosine-diphosphatase
MPTRPPPGVGTIPEELNDDIPPGVNPNTKPKPVLTEGQTPHSPEEDPDPLGTVHCKQPHTPGVPLVQYALMVDAGSTGSRIHIYKFNNCGPSASYEYEVFKMTKPGLSSYKGDPVAAASSLDVLLDEAVSVVPKELWSCTPVAVKATAGLRLLGISQSIEILNAVRTRLENRYPFKVVEKDGVVIMDGKDEGVYAWITANYLLDTIRADSAPSAHSYAVLDLGGGSTQIVFEPDFRDEANFVDGDHKYELVFGGKTRTLYQHSYLGYGLMSARKSVHRLVEFMASFNQPADGGPETPKGEIANPCLNQGSRRVVPLDAVLPGEEARNVTMVGKDVGSFDACNRIIEMVMAKNA